jgi:hypothetical protein
MIPVDSELLLVPPEAQFDAGELLEGFFSACAEVEGIASQLFSGLITDFSIQTRWKLKYES